MEVSIKIEVANLPWHLIFKHWLQTFQRFRTAARLAQPENERENFDSYGLLVNYLAPNVFPYIEETESYDRAIEILKATFIKPKNVIFARHVLATRLQKSEETLAEFLQSLRELSKDCKFEPVTAEQHREQMIRDAFINGLDSSAIRQRLLEKEDLTLDRANDLALSLDRAQEQSLKYTTTPHVATTEPVKEAVTSSECASSTPGSTSGNRKVTKKCFFCGGAAHPRSQCIARNVECFRCGKTGHFSRACKAKATSSSIIEEHVNPHLSSILASAPACLQPSVITTRANGHSAKTSVDSGSSASYINSEFSKKFGINFDDKSSMISMASVSHAVKVHGNAKVDLQVNEETYARFNLGVVDKLCADVILGLDFMKLHKGVHFNLHGHKSVLQVNPGRTKISDEMCLVMAADVDPPRIFRTVKEDCKPVATKSRRYSKEDTRFINEEVIKLLNKGIIEPSKSSWRAQVLITKDERHKRRLVVDYSQTVNRFTNLDAYQLPRIDDQINEIAKNEIYITLDLKSAYYQIPLAPEDREYTAFEANGKLYQYCRLPFEVCNGVSAFQRIIDNMIEKHNLQKPYAYIDNITVAGVDQNEHDKNLKALMDAAETDGFTFNQNKSVFSVRQLDILGYRVSRGKIEPDPGRLQPFLELPVPKTQKELKRCLGMFAYYAKWIANFSEKISLLTKVEQFPLNTDAVAAFEVLRKSLLNTCLHCIDEEEPFTVECDASDFAIAAVLNQKGRPVAFMSKTLTPSECRYPIIEKEATAIIQAVRKWSHNLFRRKFTLITDQQSLAFMFDQKKRSKVKNAKIEQWCIELGAFSNDVIHRPGKLNVTPDALSRISGSILPEKDQSNL